MQFGLFKTYERSFEKYGYIVLDLTKLDALHHAQEQLLQYLRKESASNEITLENYHNYFSEDDKHYDMQFKMLNFLRNQEFSKKILQENIELFKYLLGPDLDIQREPYLRIARPYTSGDNIGFHRDTFYGTSAQEISVLIPFVDLEPKQSLYVYPGSHTFKDSFFEWESTQSSSVQKNSKKHQMGFLYAPKVMKGDIKSHMVPVPLKQGQALVFMLSLVHGSEENRGETTRWSSDIRIKCAHAQLNPDMKEGYYVPLSESVVSKCFKQYAAN